MKGRGWSMKSGMRNLEYGPGPRTMEYGLWNMVTMGVYRKSFKQRRW